MSKEDWWVSTDGKQVYPATLESIREWLLDGRLAPNHKVRTGSQDWIEARLAPPLRDTIQQLARQTKQREMNFFLTTETTVPDYEVTRRIEVITSECAFGMNVFRDFFAGISDTFGGRSRATQEVLRGARRQCLAELKKEALDLSADAVIGIDLDYSEFSGGGKSMLFLVASGTAVRLKKLQR